MSYSIRFMLIIISLFIGFGTTVYGQASFQGLGPLPGGARGFSTAYAVSADGKVVVGNTFSDNHWQAFRWTASSGIVGLGHLPGGTDGNAWGVSSDGSVIVGHDSNKAFRWTEATGLTGLGEVQSGTRIYAAYGVSADGTTLVGGSSAATGGAYRWTQSGGLTNLGMLPGGTGSEAVAVSSDGSVVIGHGDSYNFPNTEAFRWTQDGGMVGLGTIPGGPNLSLAYGVSSDGRAIVGVVGSGEQTEAFRWTETEGMIGLGHLPGGSSGSDAHGVSADGSIIVGIGRDDALNTERAFIWDQAHGMRNLRDVLVNDYHLDLGDWILNAAYAVTPDGQTIVGWGQHGDVAAEGFIAHVPEPTSLLLLTLGGFVLSWRRW